MNKEILVIIPARGGSKGLPHKNILFLEGKPLIGRTIEKALSLAKLSRVIVSTEDKQIAEISKKFGAEVPFMRPQELAKDSSLIYDVVLDLLRTLKKTENYYPDIVVLLQAVSPFVKTEQINSAINKLIKEEVDVVYSVCESDYPPFWIQTLENEKPGMLFKNVNIKKRQDAQKTYRPTGAFYVVKTKTLLDRKDNLPMFVPKKDEETRVIITDELTATDIDTELDFLWAKFLSQNLIKWQKYT